jgi:hypothetical protein
MSALGQKQTFAQQNGMSALPPIATAKATAKRHVRFTPKADMCGATSYVRFGPIAEIDRRKSVRVRARLSVRRIVVPKRRFEIGARADARNRNGPKG